MVILDVMALLAFGVAIAWVIAMVFGVVIAMAGGVGVGIDSVCLGFG